MVVSRVMLLLFLTAQGFDGLFTYTAVHAYGLHAEGNILIATWIALVGPAAALFGAKTVAGACGVLLYARGMHRTHVGGRTAAVRDRPAGAWYPTD